MEISEPAVLTKLPRAGLSEEGSRLFSQVQGIRDGRSKKRHEVCAAIDGNALNILEVINGRTVASWPIPPDSSFTSRPYSERVHVDAKTFIRRCWCAVKRRGRVAIQYFEQVKTSDTIKTATSSHALTGSQAPVVRIEPVNTTERVVIVTQDDGTVTTIPADGSNASHTYKLAQESSSIKILAVSCTSLNEARISVLKGRPDLFSTLPSESIIINAAYEAHSTSSTTRTVCLGLWTLPTKRAKTDGDVQVPLAYHDLRSYENLAMSSKIDASFNSASTRLELAIPSSIMTFDLTASVPLKLSDRKPIMPDQIAFIELSHDNKLLLTPGKLELYNSKFDSLLASTQLNNSTLKRKRDSQAFARMSFIAYFSQLKRVLACNGSQLLAIDLHLSGVEQSSLKQSSLLIGNILRGKSEQSAMSRSSDEVGLEQHWVETARELDQLTEQNNFLEFDRRLKELCNLRTWEDLKTLDDRQVDFIISKIFALMGADGAGIARLTLALYPPETFEWCARCGILDEYRICKALRVSSTASEQSSLSRCLLETAQSLNPLHVYLRHAPYIEVSVLLAIVKALIGQALGASDADQVAQMSTGSDVDMQDRVISSGTGPGSVSILQQNTLSAKCLIHALQRLSCTGSSTVSSQLRTGFEKPEVLALIQFLRQQLFLGGYTRLAQSQGYPSPPTSAVEGEDGKAEDQVPQVALEGIVTLLNGCVDSLGVIGVLGTTEDQAFIEKMVPELRSEIDNATRGVEDSTFLQGLLRETLRYAESVERQPFEVRRKVEKPREVRGEEGKIVTLYTDGEQGDAGTHLPTALPLSLKAEEDIALVKMRKGGQLHSRSVREMGMLKDRLKAPYSFERLIL